MKDLQKKLENKKALTMSSNC